VQAERLLPLILETDLLASLGVWREPKDVRQVNLLELNVKTVAFLNDRYHITCVITARHSLTSDVNRRRSDDDIY
jgi:hypothetical protein